MNSSLEELEGRMRFKSENKESSTAVELQRKWKEEIPPEQMPHLVLWHRWYLEYSGKCPNLNTNSNPVSSSLPHTCPLPNEKSFQRMTFSLQVEKRFTIFPYFPGGKVSPLPFPLSAISPYIQGDSNKRLHGSIQPNFFLSSLLFSQYFFEGHQDAGWQPSEKYLLNVTTPFPSQIPDNLAQLSRWLQWMTSWLHSSKLLSFLLFCRYLFEGCHNAGWWPSEKYLLNVTHFPFIELLFSQVSSLSGSGGHSSNWWSLCTSCVKWGHRREI